MCVECMNGSNGRSDHSIFVASHTVGECTKEIGIQICRERGNAEGGREGRYINQMTLETYKIKWYK